MLEKEFIHELEVLGFRVECFNGEDLVVFKNKEQVARVSAFEPLKMNTMDAPINILELIVKFSSTKYDNRF